jgi:ATP-dependent Clp protease ATP-binding subunit ClpA
MSSGPVLAPDAAIVLGIASTAMPFARTHEDEVERWLRLLRLHGQVGTALQALGVSESALPEEESSASEHAANGGAGGDHDAVTRVTEHAVRVASERGARAITTADVLVAVMRVYGGEFDRALRAHGTDRAEVLARLGLDTPAAIDHHG